RACRRQPVPYTPVWFMRQAGRSLPEYRAARAGTGMLEACATPDLVTEITLQPVRRYGVDAAILFSDIVVPLRAVEPDDVRFLTEAIGALVAELGDKPLIGFAGGPFTLACYLIDGGPSKSFDKTKSMMYGNPQLWHALLDRLTDITISFLRVQVAAGASAIQLFDSWAGTVGPDDYRQAVLPHSRRIFEAL